MKVTPLSARVAQRYLRKLKPFRPIEFYENMPTGTWVQECNYCDAVMTARTSESLGISYMEHLEAVHPVEVQKLWPSRRCEGSQT